MILTLHAPHFVLIYGAFHELRVKIVLLINVMLLWINANVDQIGRSYVLLLMLISLVLAILDE